MRVSYKDADDTAYKLDLYSVVLALRKDGCEVDHGEIMTLVDERFPPEGRFGHYHGFTVRSNKGKIHSYVFTKRQMLIISGYLDPNVRCQYVEAIFKLEYDLHRRGELWQKLQKKKLHDTKETYRKMRHFNESNRDLINLLLPSINTEFFHKNHTGFTQLYNTTIDDPLRPHELKILLRDQGFLDDQFKSIDNTVIKNMPHYIELGDDDFEEVNTLFYTRDDTETVIDYLENIDDDEDPL